jgi:hypothetical protein
MPMTARLLRFVSAAALATCALASACALDTDPTVSSEASPALPGPAAGVQPAGAIAPMADTPYEITMFTQPGGQGELVYSVRGYKDPRRDAGTVVVTFASGAVLQHHYEVVGASQRLRNAKRMLSRPLPERGQNPFADHVAAVAMAVHQHHRWFEARADAQLLYGADDAAVMRHMNVAVSREHSAVGYCGTELRIAPVYGLTYELCPPERPPGPDLIDDCYGRGNGQDFECSGGPEEAWFLDQRIDTRLCCLEHDRAFWCGGTGMDGTPPPGGRGSQQAWRAANRDLVDCQVAALSEAYEDQLEASPPWVDFFVWVSYEVYLELWTFGWSLPGLDILWPHSGAGFFNLTMLPDESVEDFVARWQERAQVIAERQSSCLCGGDREVPLCGSTCRVNDCSLSAPQVLEESAFVPGEWCQGPTCQWICVEITEDGEPVARQWSTFSTQPWLPWGPFVPCTPDYEPTCECEPLSSSQQQAACEVQLVDFDGFHHSVSLPGDGDDSNGDLIELPPDARFVPPPINKPPYIRP